MGVVEDRPRTGEEALARYGFDGQRLMKLAQRVASDWLRGKAATLQNRREDLVSFLCMKALEAAIAYDPDRQRSSYGSNGGDPFQSYLADVMELRIVDFYRRQSEGFADRRKGLEGFVVQAEFEDADPDVDFEKLVSERRIVRWQRMADIKDLPLRDYVLWAVDAWTDVLERQAA